MLLLQRFRWALSESERLALSRVCILLDGKTWGDAVAVVTMRQWLRIREVCRIAGELLYSGMDVRAYAINFWSQPIWTWDATAFGYKEASRSYILFTLYSEDFDEWKAEREGKQLPRDVVRMIRIEEALESPTDSLRALVIKRGCIGGDPEMCPLTYDRLPIKDPPKCYEYFGSCETCEKYDQCPLFPSFEWCKQVVYRILHTTLVTLAHLHV